jgi:hypothetical protein
VNRAFADRYFNGNDPIGRTVLLNKRMTTIVGLAANAKQLTLRDPAPPFLYAPMSQWAFATLSSARFAIRRNAPGASAAALADAIRPLNPDWTVEIRALAADVGQSVNAERLLASCGGIFAALAILLGIVGTSGVFAYSIARRRREVGVRMALGAAPGAILRLMMRDAVLVVIAGVAGGLVALWMTGRAIEGFLFQIGGRDPVSLIASTVAIVITAGAAAAVQALRAARLDPVEVLREGN